jgi:Plasmid pRiA4b ORF-3-like protein
MAQFSTSLSTYQIRVLLCGVSPLVWWRLLIGSGTSIARLHRILQIAFAWGGEHLHRFRIHGKDYGIAYLGGISFKDDPKQVRLFEFRLRCRECFRYEYDFIANWTLEIRLEKILPHDPLRSQPICSGGRGAAPPEWCKGAWDYLEHLSYHKYHPPLEDIAVIGQAIQRFLDSEGDRRAIGDPDELREAVDRVKGYQDFQPDTAGDDRRRRRTTATAI